jgi:hypothetical protein
MKELVEHAVEQAGTADLGPGDFREGLENLLASLERDGDLTEISAAGVVADLRRRLVNRIEVEQWYAAHPEVAAVEVDGPVDITGLPRTGTTALANMLSVDARFRCLRRWEQAHPVPPPVPDSEADDQRRATTAAELSALQVSVGEKHLFELDATSEDHDVLGMAFHGQHFALPVSSYHTWWRTCDMTATYQYHRRVLQLLQSRRPPELWLLKAPHHGFHLDAFAAAYPRARFIVTHRDPVDSVPSWASIVASVLPEPTHQRDLHRLGAEAAAHLRVEACRLVEARSLLSEEQFFDVHYQELVADPIRTVRRIYAWLRLELTPLVADSIADWLEQNQTGAHGIHRYTLEQYGLRAEELRADFDQYIRYFDIEKRVANDKER